MFGAVLLGVGPAGKAVFVVQARRGKTHEAPVEMIGATERDAARLTRGVRDVTLDLFLTRMLARRLGVVSIDTFELGHPRDLQVIEVAKHGVEVECDIVEAPLELTGFKVHARHGIVSVGKAPAQRLGERGGDTVVEHVHNPADSAATVHQRGRTAQNFDAAGQQRLNGIGMILAGPGRVGAAGAVLQHAHPGASLTADDRLPHAGAERSAANPRQSAQGIADGGRCKAAQLLPAQYGKGQRRCGGLFVQRRGDEDVFHTRCGGWLRRRLLGRRALGRDLRASHDEHATRKAIHYQLLNILKTKDKTQSNQQRGAPGVIGGRRGAIRRAGEEMC